MYKVVTTKIAFLVHNLVQGVSICRIRAQMSDRNESERIKLSVIWLSMLYGLSSLDYFYSLFVWVKLYNLSQITVIFAVHCFYFIFFLVSSLSLQCLLRDECTLWARERIEL